MAKTIPDKKAIALLASSNSNKSKFIMFGIPFFITFQMFENYLLINYLQVINIEYMFLYYLLFQILFYIFWFSIFNIFYKIILRMWKWFSW